MHAGVGDDAEQMQIRAVASWRWSTAAFNTGFAKKLPLRICLGDGDRFLVDDPAGADVLVADFAVAHGAFGQADVKAAGVDSVVGYSAMSRSATGCLAKDGVCLVPLRIGVFSPSVTNDDHTGTMLRTNHDVFPFKVETMILRAMADH